MRESRSCEDRPRTQGWNLHPAFQSRGRCEKCICQLEPSEWIQDEALHSLFLERGCTNPNLHSSLAPHRTSLGHTASSRYTLSLLESKRHTHLCPFDEGRHFGSNARSHSPIHECMQRPHFSLEPLESGPLREWGQVGKPPIDIAIHLRREVIDYIWLLAVLVPHKNLAPNWNSHGKSIVASTLHQYGTSQGSTSWFPWNHSTRQFGNLNRPDTWVRFAHTYDLVDRK